MMMRRLLWTALCGAVLLSCGGGGDSAADAPLADTLTHHARLLTMAERPDGAVLVDIANPWKKGACLGSYLLVHRDSVVPADVPAGVPVVRVPVDRAAVYASVHTGAMRELGALDALVAVADAAFFPPGDTVAVMLKNGRLVDAGNSADPSAELLAASGAEVVLRSPMQGAAAPPLPPGIVAVECADYMEDTPVGRAEWILLIGELFGRRDEARAVFDSVIDAYSSLKLRVMSSAVPNPKILVETETSGVWYVAAGDSYAARMYADAGADYPWADTEGTGSLALSLEEVAARAIDADVWLVRSYGYETTPRTLTALNPRYAAFKALKEGNIYSCDTQARNIFVEASFHPEFILADYIAIFHPDVMPDYKPKYFQRKE